MLHLSREALRSMTKEALVEHILALQAELTRSSAARPPIPISEGVSHFDQRYVDIHADIARRKQ